MTKFSRVLGLAAATLSLVVMLGDSADAGCRRRYRRAAAYSSCCNRQPANCGGNADADYGPPPAPTANPAANSAAPPPAPTPAT